jgi:light-regulated signal transduction histidine kinase (bacteriophytochrome)
MSDAPAEMETLLLKSKISALEQLLEVYEKTSVEQADKLYEEISVRKAAELELEKYRIQLEELVKERTGELTTANEQLQRSIFDLTRAKEQLKKYSEDLERSNHELEHFAYVASHDLKSPILALASDLKLFEKRNREKLDAESLGFIKDAFASIKRMQNLISDLLSYARVDADMLERTAAHVNLAEALNIVLTSMKAECESAGCTIMTNEMPGIMADFNQMIQLFQNLLSNAIKFRADEPPRIEVQADRRDNEWLFSVKDNGIGIPHKHHERIFEMFQRVPGMRGHSGTGIGLSICKKIIDRHGGRIWVESQPGKGSTFYFTIPDQAH